MSFNNKIYLDNLPKKINVDGRECVDWEKSEGFFINFKYKEIEGDLEIGNYDKLKKHINVKYKSESWFSIHTSSLQKCSIGSVLGLKTAKFKIEIGKDFKDDKRDIIILAREYRADSYGVNRKWYKYHCNKCNNEDWVIETAVISQKVGCNACCLAIKKVVLGINTIWDTDRWMCDLGVSEEDAKSNTKSSGKKITVKCPDCGKEKTISIDKIFQYKSIGCGCGDGKSYPEKFIMGLLDQLNIDYEIEYTPIWSNNKRYDFYIKSNNSIIEAHGAQHPGTKYHKLDGFSAINKKARSSQQELENDNHKEKVAKDNGIKNYIVIDCSLSDVGFIKNEILNSKLSEMFNISNIDWMMCEELALKNRVKKVCEYWNDKKESENLREISSCFKLDRTTIKTYLKKGTKLGWCNYDPKKEGIKGRSMAGKKNSKPVEIFKDGVSLGVYLSASELSRVSLEIFKIKFNKGDISAVCRGEKLQYKGYTFKLVVQN